MHAPKTWHIVCQTPLIIAASCQCGDPNCAYSATVSSAVNTSIDPVGLVRV